MAMMTIAAAMVITSHAAKYTNSNPLKIVCDSEFLPYEFRDDSGSPDGCTIKTLQKILGNLNIPYTINMTTRVEANRVFYSNEADIIVSAPVNKIPGVFYTKTPLWAYKTIIVYPKGKLPIRKFNDLKKNDIVIVKEGTYEAEYIMANRLVNNENVMNRTVKQGLMGISSGDYQYMLCCETTFKLLCKKYDIDNLETSDINIPNGEIRIYSRDRQLIGQIDEQLTKMRANGELDRILAQASTIKTKRNYATPYILVSVFAILLMTITIILVNRFVTKRIRKSMQNTIETNNIMKKALDIINTNVLNTDIKKMWVTCLYGNFMPQNGVSTKTLIERLHPDDLEKTKKMFHQLTEKKTDNLEFTYKYNVGTKENPEWRLFYANAIPEYDKNGNVINQITTINDITAESEQAKRDRETSKIYKSIFDMPIVGLALYDKDGYFIEANQVMRDIFKSEKGKDDLFANTTLYNFPAFAGVIDRKNHDNLFFCTCSDGTSDNIPDHVEIRMRPIKDSQGNIIYRMLTCRNKSDERMMYRQSRQNDERVRQVSEKMTQYENELRYLLKGSKMRVWRSDIKTGVIKLYRDLHTYDAKFSFEDFINNIAEDQRETARCIIDPRLNNGQAMKDTILVHDRKWDRDTWYSINSIPEYDDNGNHKGCFGLIRNINDLMVTQIKMMKEKERANDSSRLKSTFLANMSHEIRTPLNAIVGFCDIINVVETEQERQELLKIIHNNCNNLLQIINDILVLSELDANALSISPERCDFAEEFRLLCISLAQRVQEPDVEFICDNPYEHLYTVLDQGRITQVITNFLTNAVKYTHHGHIKLGYRRQNNGLYIYCEDTGAGIPQEKLDKIFERFFKVNEYIQGAGIGLSICKAIANKCGGHINVTSEEGKGSTFSLWIPCEIEE